MTNRIITRRLLGAKSLLLLSLTFSHLVCAEITDYSHGFALSAGTEFDSNLAIENEQSSSESDTSILIGADAEFNARYITSNNKKIRLNGNYNFSESIHKEFNEFDLQTHVARAGGDYDKGKRTFGTHLTLVHALVDGSTYVSSQHISPSYSELFGTRFYSRNSIDFGKKHYSGQAFRNGDFIEAQSDLYFFQKGTSLYWLGGISIKQENTATSDYDYNGIQIKGQWIKKLQLFDFDSKARLGARWEQRNYNDSIRDEMRLRLQASVIINIDKHLSITPFFEYGDYSSDIPELDYSQFLLGVHARHLF